MDAVVVVIQDAAARKKNNVSRPSGLWKTQYHVKNSYFLPFYLAVSVNKWSPYDDIHYE